MTLYDLVISGIVFISAFLGIYLILSSVRNPKGQGLLGFGLLIISATFSYIILNSTGLLFKFPFLLRLVSPFIYLIGPLFYLYIEKNLRGRNQFHWGDILHIIPFLFHFIELIPFYLADPVVKLEIAKQIQQDINILFRNGGGILPITYHYVARIILLYVYGYAIVYQVYIKHKGDQTLMYIQAKNIALLYFVLIHLLLGIFLVGVGKFPPQLNEYGLLLWLNLFVLANIILFGLVLVDFPKNIHHLSSSTLSGETTLSVTGYDQQLLVADLSQTYIQEDLEILRNRIDLFMESGAFKDPEFSVQALANQLGIPRKDVSWVLQQLYNKKFTQLVNHYRVEAVKQMLETEEVEAHSLDGIGYSAGFSSRSSFFRIFKEVTSYTPKEYKMRHTKHEQSQST